MAAARTVLVLSENWTMVSPRDLPALVQLACDAEQAGVDTVMLSEHVVLGPDSSAAGKPVSRSTGSTRWPRSS